MCHFPIRERKSADTPYKIRSACLLLLLLLVTFSLWLSACDLPNASIRAQTTATPAPIDTLIADTAGCPAVPGKTLYVPSTFPLKRQDAQTYFLTALDEQGRQVWQRQQIIPDASTNGVGMFMASNGNLFALTFNTPKQEATLRSYDGKDGHQRWELQASWGAQLFVCNDSVYLIGLQSLRAYSVQDGHLLWQQVGDFFVYSRFSQIVSRKALVFIQNGLDIDALSAQTGKPLWRHSYPQDGHFVPVSVAVSDQAVYVLNASYDTAGMYQIEKLSLGNGQPFWSTTPFHFPSDGTFFSSIVVENGMVYIQATAGATNSLVAFDARSGKLAWQNASVLEVRILHGKSMSRNRAKQGSVHTKVPLTRRSGVAILSGVIVLLL